MYPVGYVLSDVGCHLWSNFSTCPSSDSSNLIYVAAAVAAVWLYIVSLRKRFIPLHYSQQPSMFKFVKLLRSVDDIKVGNRISSFIRHSKIV